nr:RidA family protein [Murinocardiopsis flavida]
MVTAPGLAPPVGFAHAVVCAPGRTVLLGGQTAQRPDGSIGGATVAEQFAIAVANVRTALEAAGGAPGDLAALTVYTTDVPAYRAALREIGVAYRGCMGRHYPAMALLGVSALFDEEALVELVGVAVLPE